MNTLEIYRKLKEVKFTKEQADAIIETNNTELKNLANKGDLKDLKYELKLEISKLENKISSESSKQLKWIIGIIVALMTCQTALIIGIVKL